MNKTYEINETARKRIESLRRKYRQGCLPLKEYLDAVERIVDLRRLNLNYQHQKEKVMHELIISSCV